MILLRQKWHSTFYKVRMQCLLVMCSISQTNCRTTFTSQEDHNICYHVCFETFVLHQMTLKKIECLNFSIKFNKTYFKKSSFCKGVFETTRFGLNVRQNSYEFLTQNGFYSVSSISSTFKYWYNFIEKPVDFLQAFQEGRNEINQRIISNLRLL